MDPGSRSVEVVLLAAMTTAQPSRASPRARARPLPRLAPVTTATRPCRVSTLLLLNRERQRGKRSAVQRPVHRRLSTLVCHQPPMDGSHKLEAPARDGTLEVRGEDVAVV